MPSSPKALCRFFALSLAVAGVARGADNPPVAPPGFPAGSGAFPPVSRPPTWVPPPDWRFVINNLTLVRYNPLGLENQTRIGVQKRLFASDATVSRDNFLFAGFYPKLNPAYVKLGPSVELQPLSIFNLRVGAEWINFFSTFGYLQSFQSPNGNYSPTALETGMHDKANYATSGVHLMVEPTLQFRFDLGKTADGKPKHGSIAIRNKLALEYWNMRLHATDPLAPSRIDSVWYDATLDTLVSSNGWVITNDLDVLFISTFKLTVGVRWSAVRPLYAGSDFASDADAAKYKNENAHQRVGLLAAYTFFDRGYARFNKPTVLFISSWYVDHRWRAGQDISQAIPYVLAGFAFQSDLAQ